MAISKTALNDAVIVKQQESGKGFFDSKAKLKSKEALKTEGTESQKEAAYVGSKETRSTFKNMRHSVLSESNQAISLVNEKKSLLTSADTVTKKQVESARTLYNLYKKEADPEEIAAEKERFMQLAEVSQEVEEDIAIHNIESRSFNDVSIKFGSKELARIDTGSVEFRSVEPKLDSAEELKETILALKDNKDSLRQEKVGFNQVRKDIKTATREALDELKEYSGSAIRSVEEAETAARGIADQLRSGSLDFLELHNDAPDAQYVLNSLIYDQ